MTKNSTGPTKTAPLITVTFVRREKVYYPKTEQDYKILHRQGMPVSSITEDFAPLLKQMGKGHFTFNVTDFNELEQIMFDKVRNRWPFEATLTKTTLVFKAPKRIKTSRVDKMVQAIKAWYAKHWIFLDLEERKVSKSIKFILTKRDSYSEGQ